MAGRATGKMAQLVTGKMASSAGPLIAMNAKQISNPGQPGKNPASQRNPAKAPGIGMTANVPPDPLGRNRVRPAAAYPSVGTTRAAGKGNR